MLFRVEASSPVPIYAQIVGQVRAAVAAGELVEGDSLPSVRQLAGELRVNPNTVAQAYRELEREGITYVQRGQGTFVAAMETGRREAERAPQRQSRREEDRSGDHLSAAQHPSHRPPVIGVDGQSFRPSRAPAR